KVAEMLPHLLMRDALIGSEQGSQFITTIGVGPARQTMTSCREVEAGERGVVVGERERSVRQPHRQIGTHPVEDGHEVVAQYAHAGRADAANALGVIVDESITRWTSELDV